MFVMEVFVDKTNLLLVMYGFTWKGTWASGLFFKEVISKSLSSYAENYYVFHWVDKGSVMEFLNAAKSAKNIRKCVFCSLLFCVLGAASRPF